MVLLGGGTKQRQERDIAAAKRAWRDYWNRRSGTQSQEE
jgi:putative component of toxin-antitoxin plasmid stabilization module